MNIAICDDNKQFVDTIEEYISELKAFKIQHDVFFTGESLLGMYEKKAADYDAIFLDIELNKSNGIEIANRIRELDGHVLIIFMTAHPKYMQKSFECSPFRFLVKPILKDDFYSACDAVDRKMREQADTFIFTEKKVTVRVYCDDIMFFESEGHNISVYMKDGSVHTVRSTMSKLIETIDKRSFVRVHRAFIVNLRHVYKIDDTNIYLHGFCKNIPIGRTYKPELANAFIDFKERKYLL